MKIKEPLVDVLIVSYETLGYLGPCIASVQRFSGAPGLVKIHVIDNASGEDLCSLAKLYPEVNFSRSQRNCGYGGANNLMAKQGTCQYILILNPDTVFLEENTVEWLLFHMHEKKADVIGPQLITKENLTQMWDHGEINSWKARLAEKLGSSHWEKQTEPTLAAWVSGACLLIKRKVFEEMDGFDEDFFLYKEEEDLCKRLRKKGYRAIYDPTIKIFHYGSVVAGKEKHMRPSQVRFINKHCRLWWPLARLWLKFKG